MKELGYRSDAEGICHGIVLMAIQACVTNSIDDFNQQLEFIKIHPHLKKANIRLDQPMLDVLAFLDGIDLHHNPEHYLHVFGHPLNQFHTEAIAEYTASKQLIEMGGLHKAMLWPGIYTTQELNRYFKELDSIATRINQPFSLLFSNGKHTTGIHFDPDLPGWYQLEPDKLPIQPLTTNMADWVKMAFHETSDFTAFETNLYLPRNAHLTHEKLHHAITTSTVFTDIHQVTEQKARYADNSGNTLAFIAAQNGHRHIITEMHAVGADVNRPRKDGATLALVAASYNHPLVLNVLKELGVDLERMTPFGTPLDIAIKDHAFESVRYLRWVKKSQDKTGAGTRAGSGTIKAMF